MPATLDDTAIAAILEKVDEMISWGNDIKEYTNTLSLIILRYCSSAFLLIMGQ